MELSDAKLEPVLDIIGNKDAIAVNQAWAGHPGMLVENVLAPPLPYDPSGTVVPSASIGDFDCYGIVMYVVVVSPPSALHTLPHYHTTTLPHYHTTTLRKVSAVSAVPHYTVHIAHST
jgi:hypothetical protein